MFEVKTADGMKYMVQLVGPASYRMGGQITYRGQTLTVTKRTRDYLVRKTGGAWLDFDPTPAEPIDEVMPPQFGRSTGPEIDMDDVDPQKNPPLSLENAHSLAQQGAEVALNAGAGATGPIDTADLQQAPEGAGTTPDGSGDMSGADLKKATAPASGGKTAAKASANVKITGTPKQEAQSESKAPAKAAVEVA